MEDVRFYDFEGTLKHIEHDIVSANWTLEYRGYGTFELHFPLTSSLVQVLLDNKYLVAVQGEKQAIVTGKQVTTEGVVYGRTPEWILTRFVVTDEFDTDTLFADGTITAKDAGTIAAYVMGLAFAGVDNMTVDVSGEYGEVYVENKAVTAAYDLICDCMEKDGAGFRVEFAPEDASWLFTAYKGQTLDLIVSEGNRNAYETEYTEELQDYFGGGWYEQEITDMGDWDASKNVPALTNNAPENYAKAYRVSVAGTRFNITWAEGDYIVCRDKSGAWAQSDNTDSFLVHITPLETGIYAWETPLSGTTEDAAAKELGEHKTSKRVKAKTRNISYGVDYGLGDMVLVQLEKEGVRLTDERRITGVNIWCENNDIGEQPIFEED